MRRPGGPPSSAAAYLRERTGSSRSYLISEQIEAVKSLKLQSASRHGVIISGRLLSLPSLRISSRSQFLKPLNSLCSPSSSFEVRLFYLPQRRIAINFVPSFHRCHRTRRFLSFSFVALQCGKKQERRDGWITDDAMPLPPRPGRGRVG